MFKYEDKIYKNSKGERVSVTSLIFDQGFIGYDVELIDEGNKQLYNITEEELEGLLK